MTPKERMELEARIGEIGIEIERLRRQRIELRRRLVHGAAEWLDAQARLSAVQSREERAAAAAQARAARRAHRDPNPPHPALAHEERDDA